MMFVSVTEWLKNATAVVLCTSKDDANVAWIAAGQRAVKRKLSS